MITIFTPSFADEANTNAQNLSVKEIVARLDPDRAAVTMLHEGSVDPRIAARPNTRLLRCQAHGNTLRIVPKILRSLPQVYFFPREGPLDATFLRMRRIFQLKTAVVSYVVSGGLYAESYPPARQRNIREADAVFANNNYLSQLLSEKLGVSAGIMYDGIDRRFYFPRESPREVDAPISVLYAGSFRRYKRVPLVIREAERLPNVSFRLAGSGEEEQACMQMAVDRSCKNVEFLGHLSSSKLGDEMRRADVFFFPSNVEGHPQVLGQAAACGLPVIAMKVYRPDYVVNDTTGFLAESDAELSEKLEVLVRWPELRRAMGAAAIAHARKFDWEIITRQWLEIFETAASQRSKR